jgi:hypothetical protein
MEMTMQKPTQSEFEKKLQEQLELKSFERKILAAAHAFLKTKFGNGALCHPHVARDLAKRFGVTQKDRAIRCMGYILQKVVDSGQVCAAYEPIYATSDAWDELKPFLDADTDFDFEREHSEEFRKGFQLLEGGKAAAG